MVAAGFFASSHLFCLLGLGTQVGGNGQHDIASDDPTKALGMALFWHKA